MYEYPFGNGQQLNLDWFLAEWKNLLAAWEAEKNGIEGALQAEIDKAEAALADVFAARDAAAQSAANALESKNAAAQSASDASGYLATVRADANTAHNAAQNAAQSESNAADSAQTALASKNTAANSERNAAQSEQNALGYKNAAAQSAANALANKDAAAQSEANALQSKNAAAQSASDAEDAASSVEASSQQIATNTSDIAKISNAITTNEAIIASEETLFYPVNGSRPNIWPFNPIYLKAGQYYLTYWQENDVEESGRNTPRISYPDGNSESIIALDNVNKKAGLYIWVINIEQDGNYKIGYWCQGATVDVTLKQFTLRKECLIFNLCNSVATYNAGYTANKTYSANTLICINGTIYKTLSYITRGTDLIINSNITPVNISNFLTVT